VTVDVNTDNLDDFSKLMFGEAKPIPVETEEKTEEPKVETEEVTEKDVDEDSVAPEETEETTESEEEAAEEPKPEEKKEKPKSRFQERIDQLTHQNKETQRLLDEALARLNVEADKKDKPAVKLEDTSPKPEPTDLKEDGEEKYPLGEFDPLYIRDLTVFTIHQENEKIKAEDTQRAAQAKMDEARTALHSEWAGKLEKAHDVYPDLKEKQGTLQETFTNLEPAYGEYLASTIMSMDKGVDVLNYLVNNIEEAKRIAASGPNRATIALGRLEARFIEADEEKEVKKPKVSNAPTPPPVTTRGTGTKTAIAADTDDLESFEKLFYSQKR